MYFATSEARPNEKLVRSCLTGSTCYTLFMAIRKISFASHEFYHVYNRGNSKQKIFHDTQDYKHFVNLLYIANTLEKFNLYDLFQSSNFQIYNFDRKDTLVHIGAYALMPNHFHVLLTEAQDGGISKFMQKLGTAYAMYYNQKYDRTGSLFEGKFKARHTDSDPYLKYTFSYIHLNPVKLIQNDWKKDGIKNKKQALDFLQKYEYSSYFDFLGVERLQSKVLSKEAFPRYFPKKEHFQKEIFDWLSFGENIIEV